MLSIRQKAVGSADKGKKAAAKQEGDRAVGVDPEKKKMELAKIKVDAAPEMKNSLMGLTDYSLQKKGDNGKHPENQEG